MKKKYKVLIATFMGIACLYGGFAFSNIEAKATTVAYVSEIFNESTGVNMETEATDSLGRKCLSLRAFKNDASFTLSKHTVGDYRFYFNNEKYGDKEFSLNFKASEGAFSVKVRAKGSQLNAWVELNGKKGGIYYESGRIVGETKANNEAGKFTQIPNTKNSYVRFDPLKMCIYLGNDSTELLVWDLSKSLNDSRSIGGTLLTFQDYLVKLGLTKGDVQETLFVYAVNGDSLDKDTLVDFGSPSVYATAYTNMKVGEEYLLPTPSAYDLFDGEIKDFSVAVKKGKKTILPKREYTTGMTFTPEEGDYTVTYFATDKAGNIGEYSVAISAKSYELEESFNASYILDTMSWGVGSSIELPNVCYVSNYGIVNVPCTLTVELDGKIVEGYNNVLFYNQTLGLKNPGVYTLKVTPVDANVFAYQEYEIIASEALPAIHLPRYEVSMYDTITTENQSVTFNGKTYLYDTIIYYPDGKAYIGNSFTLNQSGKYTMEYRFKGEDSNVYKYKASFNIYEALYSFYTDKTYAYIGANQYNDNMGLNVCITAEDSFAYSKVINVSDNTKNEPLIEILATPAVFGSQELKEFQIILTDIYDESNYITIDIVEYQGTREAAYAKIAPAGELLAGYEGNTLWKDIWGTYFRTSLYGENSCANNPVKIYFDYAEKKMFVENGGGLLHIADLDEYTCFDTIWTGFTTGEVRLTVKGVSFAASSANFFINSIDGETFDSDRLIDTVAPSIQLDLGAYEASSLPIAVTGKEYSLFSGSAFDPYVGNVKLQTNVYFNYGKDNQSQINVNNGKFTPNMEGKYTIVYTAYDQFGNKAEKFLTVIAENESSKISVESIENDFVTVGEKYVFPDMVAFGGSGVLSVAIYVELDGQYIPVEATHIFDKAGVYNVKFVATDYIGQSGEYVYQVTAEYSEKPIFSAPLQLPSTLINGKTYNLKEMTAKYYASGIEGVDAQISVYLEDKNGKHEIVGKTFTPQVEQSGEKVKLIYEATYGTAKDSYVYELPTVKVNEGRKYYIENYFSVTGGETSITEKGVSICVNSNQNEIEFLNELLANGFNISFNVNPQKNKVGAITLFLFDAENISNAVKFTIYNTNGTKSSISINDSNYGEMQGSFMGTSNYSFNLTYDNEFFKISDSDSYYRIIEKNFAGEMFKGFESGRVRFKLVLEDVTGETEIVVDRLNNQNISTLRFDLVEPQIALLGGAYKKVAKIGDVIAVKDVACADVFSLGVVVSYSVLYNGKVYNSIDGVVLKSLSLDQLHSFKCEQTGKYVIRYDIKDESGNPYTYDCNINVFDKTAPVISIDGVLIETGTVGSAIMLPNSTATDNVDSKLVPFVVVCAPSGIRVAYIPGSQVLFNEKGIYNIKYVVYDSIGNISEISFNVVIQ